MVQVLFPLYYLFSRNIIKQYYGMTIIGNFQSKMDDGWRMNK